MHRRRYTVEENELEKKFSLAERERDEYRRLYLEMMERYRKLERGILGSKSEHLPPNESQLTLDVLRTMLDERERSDLESALDAAAAGGDKEITVHVRRKPTGRKPLPKHLERIRIEVFPLEVQNAGLDAFERIGERRERRSGTPPGLDGRRADRTREVRAQGS